METLEIPVKVSIWSKYRGLVLIPPRNHELKRKLMERLNSGMMCYGVLKAIMYGEPRTFKVGTKFYVWHYVNDKGIEGLNTVFVITETDCKICIEDIVEYINEYGNVRGTLTLYLP